MVLQAFLGDRAVKAATIDRIRTGLDARAITPFPYLKWSGNAGFASLAGTIGETQDPQLFEQRSGLPLPLALLSETLINAGIAFHDDAGAPYGFTMDGDPAIWSFGVEWLSAIPVGADVGDVVARFLPVLFDAVLSDALPQAAHVDAAVRDAGAAIVALWQRELQGEAVPRAAWRTVRAQALAAAQGASDPAGLAVADLIESLPWPGQGIAAELPVICRSFLHLHLQLLAARSLPELDWASWSARLVADRRLALMRADPRNAQLADPALLDLDPALKSIVHDPGHAGRAALVEAAMPNARRALTPWLRALMDALLQLLRERPG